MEKNERAVSITPKNMSEIWEKYKRLAFYAAKPFIKGYPQQKEDIEQECYFAIADAVKHYNPNKCAFSTCLFPRVIRRVGEYCRRNSCAFSLPENQFKKERRLQRAQEALYAGNISLYRSLSFLSDYSREAELNTVAFNAARTVSSFSQPINDADGLTIGGAIPDKENGIDAALDRIEQRELRAALDTLLLCLNEKDRDFVKRRYYDGQTLAEIGKFAGKNSSYAYSRIHASLEKMRRKAEKMRIFDEYLDSRTRSKALRGGLASFNTSWTSSTERAAFDRIEKKMRVNWNY